MVKLAVFGYLISVVLANLGAYYFGPWAIPFIAFVAIGFDLTCRDYIHERWHSQGGWGVVLPRMGNLIIAGSVLTILVNPSATRIGLASLLAFAVSAAVDTVVFHYLIQRPRFERVNYSNLVAAMADSMIFPTVAFGLWMPWVVAAQFLAKVLGGLAWSLVLFRDKGRTTITLADGHALVPGDVLLDETGGGSYIVKAVEDETCVTVAKEGRIDAN